ncbi:MAG TPA: SsrA-binding protein SmpB [Bacteroidia bacterium]|nr:SsrA-binding protein SmpB [Bacteroidia bacterium]HRS58227.1 SsrA-binding protein SmpB [Bacteroidia bacterium]HRU68652.1 SsrA-binding protein SmpB [Bacteroidia bacterium]
MATNIYIPNKKARFENEIIEIFKAGIVLTGTEIKSVRQGKVSFTDSFCFFQNGELFIKNLHISEYSHGNIFNHDPVRLRKLLLTKRELRKLNNKVKEKGLTIVPLSIYINERGFAKADIALARGKKLYDKREALRDKHFKRHDE